jgi:ankyrin repeat protein
MHKDLTWDYYFAAVRRPLELGAKYDFLRAVQRQDIDRVIADLLKCPELVHQVRGHLSSPLAGAAGTRNKALVQLLLDQGADPTMPKFTAPFGIALYCAVNKNYYEVAKLLLDHGADPMCYSDSSGDCLFVAHHFIQDEQDRAEMIALLNEYSGKEYIIIPQRNEDPPVVETQAKVREVLSCDTITDSQVGHLLWVIMHIKDVLLLEDFINRLGDRAKKEIANTDARDHEGRFLKTLFAYGARIHPLDVAPKQLGETVLHWNEDLAIVEEFVNEGGDINAIDFESGKTALGIAATEGHIERVRVLLAHGANPSLPHNSVRDRPVQLAEEYGHEGIAKLLRQ